MDTSYVPLRLRSNWSLLRGASPVGDYLARAASLGLSSLALTDDNLFGAVPFFEEAKEFGIKPILGATLDETDQDAVVLVENNTGYANLCRILTARELDEDFSLEKHLVKNGAGLILVTRDVSLADKMRDPFRGRVYVDVSSGRRYEGELPITAAPDVFFAKPADFEVHRLLSAFRLGGTKESILPSQTADPKDALRSPKEMARRFRCEPAALTSTHGIAERCDFDLLDRPVVFPCIAGDEGPRILREKAMAGARGRYGRINGKVHDRIEHELVMIIGMGFADYFLVMEDIVRHARRLGTPTAGRGSGAGSLVAYVLGITNVDPFKYDLPFERFLNPGRPDYPDLDVDFCWRLRDDVIDYTYSRFGHDRVAMIATYATFQPRLALRETAKAFGLSNPVITKIARKLRKGLGKNRFHTLDADPGVIERVVKLSARIQGFPHHLSVHCGGVVITPGPINGYAPLLRAEKGVVITAFDKEGVERIGLVKLDLLGNRSLTTISETVRRIEARTGERIDPERLPENEARAFALIRSGRTVGCGQLESPAMRHLLIQMRPRRILHIMQALALIRPGAAGMGMKETFVKRRQGKEGTPAMPEALGEVLGEAYGVMLYEDDAMRIAMALAGFDSGEADRLRKAVIKNGGSEEAKRLSGKFIARSDKKGVDRAEAETILRHIAKFRSYSFCRAHAASYGQLAYASAYLKALHPLEYWCAALNNNEGMYPKWTLVEEAKRSGIRFLPPCVNRSEPEFAVEGDAIRAGLNCIGSLSSRTVERILELRPLRSLEDLVTRVRPREEEAEILIQGGAMDFAGLPRNHLLWKLMTSLGRMREAAERREEAGALFSLPATSTVPSSAVPLLPELSESSLWEAEWEIMGFTCREHPLAPCREALRKAGIDMSTDIPRKVNRDIRLAGVIAATRRTRTEKGDMMQFLTLDDEAGVFEAVLFPDAYERTKFLLDGPGPFVVEGRVDDQYGALNVTARRMERLDGYL